ncbi:MAG: hypothetical protein KIT84_28990 [Labilithrix sp.]|nr:hypothetical protein [Labilithrix sp.]MCW5815097.1 hypothetical protein [Labilithrix sp.]
MPFRLAACAAAFALVGCSTTLSTLQPSEPMKPGHVQATGALNVNVPASRIIDAVDTTATLGDRYASNPQYQPSDVEQRQALAAAVGLGLSSPGVTPDIMLRMGVVKNLDVGLRWSSINAHLDAKYRFLTTKDPTAEEENDAGSFGNGPDRGFQGAISIGVSKSLYNGFVFDLFEQLEIDDYSRWNIEVPVIFGTRMKDFGHVWFGPKYIYSRYSVDAILQNVGAVPRTSGSIHHIGGFGGVAVGYKVFFVFLELTVAKMFAEPTIFGQKTDLGGIVAMPAFGLMLRL